MSDVFLLRSYEAGEEVVKVELGKWLESAGIPRAPNAVLKLSENRTVVLIKLDNVSNADTEWKEPLKSTLEASLLLKL